jgi:hypothetical protein
MGADVIGWRNCPLQERLEPQGFLGKLKLRAYLQVIESQVPEGQRETVTVQVRVSGRETRALSYPEIQAGAEEFQRGIPECSTCPISGGAALGCYQYVRYPVDEVFEKLVFDFFVSQVQTEDSICDQLYRDIVSKQPPGSGWHTQRGPEGALARLPRPLEHRWGGLFSKKHLDSAQILASLFFTQEHTALIVAYGRFWSELVDFARKQGVSEDDSYTLREVTALARFYLLMTASALSEGAIVLIDG